MFCVSHYLTVAEKFSTWDPPSKVQASTTMFAFTALRALARQVLPVSRSALLCKPVSSAFQMAPQRLFSTTPTVLKTNTSTRTKENVHDLETFLKLIGRDTIEHLDAFEGDLQKFLNTTSKQMKNMGIDTSQRRYLLRWKHKFVNDLEPLREHKRGKKKNGGERKAKAVKAKRRLQQMQEEREKWATQEKEAEDKGERDFWWTSFVNSKVNYQGRRLVGKELEVM